MVRKETIFGAMGLVISIGLIVFSITQRDYLAGITNIIGYSLVGVFLVSLIAASAISVTLIPIPYYALVFVLPGILSAEWGLLAPAFVGTASAAGASLGQLPTYMLGYGGKQISKRLAARFNDPGYHRLLEWIRIRGSAAVFLVSAVPNPLHLPITLALGALKLPPVKWFILTFMGNLSKSLTIAFIGYFAINNVS